MLHATNKIADGEQLISRDRPDPLFDWTTELFSRRSHSVPSLDVVAQQLFRHEIKFLNEQQAKLELFRDLDCKIAHVDTVLQSPGMKLKGLWEHAVNHIKCLANVDSHIGPTTEQSDKLRIRYSDPLSFEDISAACKELFVSSPSKTYSGLNTYLAKLLRVKEELSACHEVYMHIPKLLEDSNRAVDTLEQVSETRSWLYSRIEQDYSARTVQSVSQKFQILILHGWDKNSHATAGNSLLIDGVSFNERLKIIQTFEPTLACSHFRPGLDNALNLWSPVGIILSDGIIIDAKPEDAATQAKSIDKIRFQNYRSGWIEDKVNDAINQRDKVRYSEFTVRKPQIAGIYLYRSDSDVKGFAEKYVNPALESEIKEVARAAAIPLYIIQDGQFTREELSQSVTIAEITSAAHTINNYNKGLNLISFLDDSPFRCESIEQDLLVHASYGITNYNLINWRKLSAGKSDGEIVNEVYVAQLSHYNRYSTEQPFLSLVKFTFTAAEGGIISTASPKRSASKAQGPQLFIPGIHPVSQELPDNVRIELQNASDHHQQFMRILRDAGYKIISEIERIVRPNKYTQLSREDKLLPLEEVIAKKTKVLTEVMITRWAECLLGYALEASVHGDKQAELDALELAATRFSNLEEHYQRARDLYNKRVRTGKIRISREELVEILGLDQLNSDWQYEK